MTMTATMIVGIIAFAEFGLLVYTMLKYEIAKRDLYGYKELEERLVLYKLSFETLTEEYQALLKEHREELKERNENEKNS